MERALKPVALHNSRLTHHLKADGLAAIGDRSWHVELSPGDAARARPALRGPVAVGVIGEAGAAAAAADRGHAMWLRVCRGRVGVGANV